MKASGMEDFAEQASLGLLGMTGRKAKEGVTRYQKFLEAIKRLPPPPCNGCPLLASCGEREVACELFWQYVHSLETWMYDTPPTREPSKRIYKLLHRDDDKRNQFLRKGPVKYKGTLSDKIVRAIRADSGTNAQIADRHNVGIGVARRIRAGVAYQWVR